MLNPDINSRQIENYVIFYSQFEITIQNYRLNVRTTWEMTYEKFINNILETRGRFNCGDEYHERHHIVPKCMGGTNDEENLIDLFAREHFEAHRLLALENPTKIKLIFAWNMMCNSKNADYQITAQEYEEARKIHGENMSKLLSGKPKSEEHKQHLKENHADFSGINHPQYGTHLSDEHKKKLSNFAKTRTGDKNPNYGNHKLKGHKLSETTKQKISEAKKGHDVSLKTRKAVAESSRMRVKHIIQCDINMNLIKIWNSAEYAHVALFINKSSINACCRGDRSRKTAGGYCWNYLYAQTRKDGTIIPGAITLGLITEEEALRMLAE